MSGAIGGSDVTSWGSMVIGWTKIEQHCVLVVVRGSQVCDRVLHASWRYIGSVID